MKSRWLQERLCDVCNFLVVRNWYHFGGPLVARLERAVCPHEWVLDVEETDWLLFRCDHCEGSLTVVRDD